MKFFSSVVTFLASVVAVSALPAALDTRQNELETFKLVPGCNAPAAIAALGNVQWNGTFNEKLGWFTPTGSVIDLFIQYNKRQGIAFYSQNTVYEIYLAPTHGTPSYYMKMGNPKLEPNDVLTLEGNWTVTSASVKGNETKLYWGWAGNWENVWSACGAGDDYVLYYGTFSEPRTGCTEGFSLEVNYD
ncbi:hypothetical protein RUND412_001223 [Rhizina undulata]